MVRNAVNKYDGDGEVCQAIDTDGGPTISACTTLDMTPSFEHWLAED
jgi:hypothetical protein